MEASLQGYYRCFISACCEGGMIIPPPVTLKVKGMYSIVGGGGGRGGRGKGRGEGGGRIKRSRPLSMDILLTSICLCSWSCNRTVEQFRYGER